MSRKTGRTATLTTLTTATTGALVLLIVMVLPGCQSRPAADNPLAAASAPADPLAEAAQNVRLVGYNDLQGRTALVVTTRSDAANGNWVYVGHHESFAEEKPLLNPITGPTREVVRVSVDDEGREIQAS